MKKLGLVLLLTTGLFSCSEYPITPEEAFEKFGTDSAILKGEHAVSSCFEGRKTWEIRVDIKDKNGDTYDRLISVSDTVYQKAYHSSYNNYIKFK